MTYEEIAEAAEQVAREAQEILAAAHAYPLQEASPLNTGARDRREMLLSLRVRVDQIEALHEEVTCAAVALPPTPEAEAVPLVQRFTRAGEHVKAAYREALLLPFQR